MATREDLGQAPRFARPPVLPPARCTCLGRRTDPTESIWQCRSRSVRIHRRLVHWTWTLDWTLHIDLAPCTLHLAPCTLLLALAPLGVQAAGRLARWGYSNWGHATCCSGESMRTEHCSFVLLFPCLSSLPSSAQHTHPWPTRDFAGRANATHARSSDAPDRIKPPP
jgi:hypothetical protein